VSRGSSCTRRIISYLCPIRGPSAARRASPGARAETERSSAVVCVCRQLPHAMGMPRSRRAHHAHTASRTRRGTWDDATTVDGGHRDTATSTGDLFCTLHISVGGLGSGGWGHRDLYTLSMCGGDICANCNLHNEPICYLAHMSYRLSGPARGPQRVSMRGGRWGPMARRRRRFFGFFFAIFYLFSWEFGVLAAMLSRLATACRRS